MIFIATIYFFDTNMPAIHEDAPTSEAAGNALGHLFMNFAGVKSGDILCPDGSKNVFNSRGDYLFTIPKIEVKE